jgi:hypothetical protein
MPHNDSQSHSNSYSHSEYDSKYLEPEAQRYSAKLVVMKERFISILDDFKKYYVFSAKNPEVDEYHQHYLNSKSHLQTINKEVFTNISKRLNPNGSVDDKKFKIDISGISFYFISEEAEL